MEFSLITLFALFTSLYSVDASPPKEVCLLQVDEGPCRAEIPRYYYNTITQKCEEFYYGGCQGNANNFRSYETCHKTCFKIPKIPQICRFPQDTGPCRALFTRYSYNMTSAQCELFYYGGCQGNNNRFQDLTSCKEYCSPHKTVPVLCLDPLDRGRCAATIPRFYYNKSSRMCEEFVYSGCGGSSNNFVSRQSCIDVCGKGGKKHVSKRQRIKRTRNPIVFRQA